MTTIQLRMSWDGNQHAFIEFVMIGALTVELESREKRRGIGRAILPPFEWEELPAYAISCGLNFMNKKLENLVAEVSFNGGEFQKFQESKEEKHFWNCQGIASVE